MIILGIETSCDDTGIAVIRAQGKKNPKIEILSNLLSSQIKIHQKYGGVYPFLAKREHQKNLPVLFEKIAKRFKFLDKPKKVDLIAVTIGPGLDPCLWVGVNFAKKLAKELHTSLVPVNHIEAHIVSGLLKRIRNNSKFSILNSGHDIFPAVCLVVSGGHTQLILVKKIGKYKILGETRDDAAGECFDKIGRMLGLGYPGGPAIEKEALKFKPESSRFKISLPRPMMNQKNYDFSFSGLKTAALYTYKKEKSRIKASKEYIKAMAAEVQQAVIDVLISKTIKAAKEFKAKTIMLGGGVVANKELRTQFRKKIKKELLNVKYLIPQKKYCTDNALMVAVTGYLKWIERGKRGWKKIKVNANLKI